MSSKCFGTWLDLGLGGRMEARASERSEGVSQSVSQISHACLLLRALRTAPACPRTNSTTGTILIDPTLGRHQ